VDAAASPSPDTGVVELETFAVSVCRVVPDGAKATCSSVAPPLLYSHTRSGVSCDGLGSVTCGPVSVFPAAVLTSDALGHVVGAPDAAVAAADGIAVPPPGVPEPAVGFVEPHPTMMRLPAAASPSNMHRGHASDIMSGSLSVLPEVCGEP
jgi:hypothetical protein